MQQIIVGYSIGALELELLFFDADIEEELKQAKSQDFDEAECAMEQAQRLINSLWKFHHALAHSIAFKRQAELDAIRLEPWKPNALFNGQPLFLGNRPEIPWDGYPISDAERARSGLIPEEARDRSRLYKHDRIHGSTRGRRYYPYHQ